MKLIHSIVLGHIQYYELFIRTPILLAISSTWILPVNRSTLASLAAVCLTCSIIIEKLMAKHPTMARLSQIPVT